MWTVVYIAPDRGVAEKLKSRLEGEGLLVMARPSSSQLTEACHYELLVPESELEEAQEVLSLLLEK
jgi:hypothetical protein